MKILVAGDVKGDFNSLFNRVGSIHKKNGPFEMLLCVGDFFNDTPECKQNWKELIEGKETVPLPTYILGPVSSEHAHFYADLSADGGEMCANITCLGQRGVYTTSSGLTIAYLSGRHKYDAYKTSSDTGKMTPYFTNGDIASVESQCKGKENFKGVDILLTSEWPRGVDQFAQPPEELDMKQVGAQPISRLAYSLKPRYHFTALHQRFYDRTPYRNHQVLQGTQRHVTRFIALADVGNPDKKNRYLYAFSITPMSVLDGKELTQQPPAVTNNPYTNIVREKVDPRADLPEQNFFFDQRAIAAGHKRKQQQHNEGKRPPLSKRPPVPRGPCWFCLGGEEVEKHLVVSVGENSYVALPKGGLVSDHVLILPIGHYAASTDAPREVVEEMSKFKLAMRRYCHSVKKSCVIFERNFKSQHLQLQVIPVPEIPSDALRQAFVDHGKGAGLQLNEVAPDVPIDQLAHVGDPYFLAEFDEGASLFTRIKGRFPLQFGREVLASTLILNIPERVDWKNCPSTKEEETASAQNMRTQFQPFDFTDDD